jgi:very-short-patch-repair endonuclease
VDAIARSDGRRGVPILHAAIAREPRWTRNEFEARCLSLVRHAGLATPRVNHFIAALDHMPCEVDFLWPSHRRVVETDGWESHHTRAAFERDRRRDAALVASGLAVLRFTWRQLRDRPRIVADRLRMATAAR